MDSPTTSSEPSSSAPQRSNLWKRVAGGIGVFLLCYFGVAYLIVPQVWKSYARHRPTFDDNPRLTKTGDGHPGDALNVALTGTDSQLKAIMLAAKWYPADPLGLRSDLRIGADTVLKQSYDEAPVSKLFLYGRPEDFAFEQPVGDDPRHRHHVRLWRSKKTDQDRPIWVGAATYDERVGLSHTTGQITHHTAADIDTERANVFDTFQHTEGLAERVLEPGDIILTFTAGYISDIFIPGAFKHAITFVGPPQDRHSAGLTADRIAWLPDAEREVLLKSISVAKLPSGQDADVIEAVGEGVIFNHLGHIMDTHINRMLVLRPKVSNEERTHALANVFLFLGDEYDFKFDFADASKQVCTEVVYRAFDGKASIQFSLIQRAGHETLSADDIANNYLAAPGKAFDFVLFAEEASDSQEHRARILKGEVGTTRVRELMATARPTNQRSKNN